MKLLRVLRRLFAVDTNEIPPFDPGRIHGLLAEMRSESAQAIRPTHS